MTQNTSPGIVEGGLAALRKRVENTLLIGIPAVGSIAAVAHIWQNGISWSDVLVFVIFYFWSGLGLALGFHRLFSHRSFRPHFAIAAFLCAGGTMGFQGSPLRWALDHRRHHALSDRPGDVHSPHFMPDGTPLGPVAGFWHAHVGWMFDRWTTDEQIFGHGLRDDPVLVFFTKTHLLWLTASFGLPWSLGYALGDARSAWSAMLIGGCLRTTLLHNIVWSVNSFGHSFGKRNHLTPDRSTDNLWLAVLTFGDGWHNGHHSAPRSYRHGLAKRQFDANGNIILHLQSAGLAEAVCQPVKTNYRETPDHV